MALNSLLPSTIGGGDPRKTFLSTNDIISQVTGAPPVNQQPNQVAPLTPTAPSVQETAPRGATVEAPLATKTTEPYKNKYDQIYDEAEQLLSKSLEQKQPFSNMGLALSRGFFRPTKTGSFGESLGNVAEEVQKSQDQEARENVTNLQARMALARSGSERQKEKDVEVAMGNLYQETPKGYRINPQVALKIAGILKDPKFLEQYNQQVQQDKIREVGMSILQPRKVEGKDGEPAKTVMDFNPNSVYELMKISSNPMQSLSEVAKLIPELRKSGMLSGLQEEGTPFDALIMMAPTPAIKQQAEYLAKKYVKGTIDPDKGLAMANQMITMATAHMDKEATMKFHQANQALMSGMRQDSLQLQRDKFAELQKENEKKLTPEQNNIHKNVIVPIINQGLKAGDALTALQQIEDVTKDAPSGFIKGALANSVGKLFGTDDNTALANLNTLSKSLVTLIPRLPGSASNLDAKNLEASIGELADPYKTNEQRLKLINSIKKGFESLQNKSDEIQDYWKANKEIPRWAKEKSTEPQPVPAPQSGGFKIIGVEKAK
jgi:cytochrome c556